MNNQYEDMFIEMIFFSPDVKENCYLWNFAEIRPVVIKREYFAVSRHKLKFMNVKLPVGLISNWIGI